jgi:hypothetical protein
VRDRRRHLRGVLERGPERLPQELAHAIAAFEQLRDALAGIGDRLGRSERAQLGARLRVVLERGRIDHENLRLAVGALHTLVEPLAGLLARPSLREHLLDERRQHERGACGGIRQPFGEVADHVRQDVDAREIQRAERGALRPSDRRPVDRVDLFDRVGAGCDERQRTHDVVEREVVADEVRRVLRDDYALAQVQIGKRGHAVEHRRVGLGRRDQLEQTQVARRIEEVRSEPVAPEVVAATLGEHADRNARRVGADDAAGPPRLVHALEERALGVELLDDALDDPIRFAESRQAVVERRGGDELPAVRQEEGVRLEPTRALQPLRGGVGGDVEQE